MSKMDFETTLDNLMSPKYVQVILGATESSQEDPYYVERSKITAVSDHFDEVVRSEEWRGNVAILKFTGDNVQACKILLYWIIHNNLECKSEIKQDIVLIRCWVLGDKYGIVDFQDEIIVELLDRFEDHDDEINISGNVKEVFETTEPESPLRKLYAEELVKRYEEMPEWANLGQYNGVAGLLEAMMEAKEERKNNIYLNHNWFYKSEDGRDGRWTEFLVGDGSNLSWRPEHWNEA